MKLSLRTLSTSKMPAGTPDYEVFEREVTLDEALAFLGKLVSSTDIVYLETPHCLIEFWKHDGTLWLEISGVNFWATSDLNETEARAIIQVLEHDHLFGDRIPASGREWYSYAPLRDDVPGSHCAT